MLNLDALTHIIASKAGFDPAAIDVEALIESLPPAILEQLAAEAIEIQNRDKYNMFERLFPNEGPLRRELYPKHIEFFNAGKNYFQRCFMAANRVGKTIAGGYEVAAHTTGLYPDWWEGRVFRRPGEWWVAGDTNETTRDILQKTLFGEVTWKGNERVFDGTGMVPRDLVGEIKWKRGVADLADTVKVKHRTGGWAKIGFKSYDQGRRVFQGTAKQGIWLDEECPQDVEGECLIRLATTRGLLLLTFTPLNGLTEVVLSYLPKEFQPGESIS